MLPNCHLYSQHRLGCFEILDIHVRISLKKATILFVMSFESARSLILTSSYRMLFVRLWGMFRKWVNIDVERWLFVESDETC